MQYNMLLMHEDACLKVVRHWRGGGRRCVSILSWNAREVNAVAVVGILCMYTKYRSPMGLNRARLKAIGWCLLDNLDKMESRVGIREPVSQTTKSGPY